MKCEIIDFNVILAEKREIPYVESVQSELIPMPEIDMDTVTAIMRCLKSNGDSKKLDLIINRNGFLF